MGAGEVEGNGPPGVSSAGSGASGTAEAPLRALSPRPVAPPPRPGVGAKRASPPPAPQFPRPAPNGPATKAPAPVRAASGRRPGPFDAITSEDAPATTKPDVPDPRPSAGSLSDDDSVELWGADEEPERPPAQSVLPPPPVLRTGEILRRVGRCEVHAELATGGMATVYLGRWLGAGGFTKTVAIKALHRQYARDPEFVRMFLDEARVVARIRHPNVMPIVDLQEDDGELFIVMEYALSATLAQLLRQLRRRGEHVPVPVALRVLSGVLHGLHAAHEATDAKGAPLAVIHRDVSPENVLVGADGYARLIDFGIATALGRATSATERGHVKGKLAYLAPEQIQGDTLDRRADIFSASVVLWQTLTGRRLFKGDNMGALAVRILEQPIAPPSHFRPDISPELDAVVTRGLARDRDARWPDAESMAEAIETLGGLASHREVGEWARSIAAKRLEHAAGLLRAVEGAPLPPSPETPIGATPAATRRERQTIPVGPPDAELSTDLTLGRSTRPMAGGKRKLVAGAAIAVLCTAALLAALSAGGSETNPAPAASATPTTTSAPLIVPTRTAAVASATTSAPDEAPPTSAASATTAVEKTAESASIATSTPTPYKTVTQRPPPPPKPPPRPTGLPNDI